MKYPIFYIFATQFCRTEYKEVKETIFQWGHSRRFNDYSTYIKKRFSHRVQKLSINAGFTCPNRDGTKGTGGCIYCYNKTFQPDYCSDSTNILTQLEQGISFFAKKYETQKYLAYYQAYTNTYANTADLIKVYSVALSHPKVIGLVIATRPDCVSDELLDFLSSLSKQYYIIIEYGVESTLDKTLQRINRGHTYKEVIDAIERTNTSNIKAGAHLILGLPGENRAEILSHAQTISKLPVHTLKLHQLQIVENTILARQYKEGVGDIHLFSAKEYIDLAIDFLERLDPEIIVERFVSQSPRDLLIAPTWGLKNFEIVDKIDKRLKERDTYQGRFLE